MLDSENIMSIKKVTVPVSCECTCAHGRMWLIMCVYEFGFICVYIKETMNAFILKMSTGLGSAA